MLNLDKDCQVLFGLTAAAIVKHYVSWWLRERRHDRFELVGTVSQVWIYPFKSCRGILVDEAECAKLGLKVDGCKDRHWMLTRSNGRFLSQRQAPKMALISVSILDDTVKLNAPGKESFLLPKNPVTQRSKLKECCVWDAKVEGIDCGDDVALWVSDFLSMPGLRVVHYAHDLTSRNFINEIKPWSTSAVEEDASGYADWGSYLFLTVSSLEKLNKHLQRKVTMRSFRPNIVIDGTDAFDEDNWEEIRIGESVQMRCLDGCSRCILTTVDPDTGVKSEDGEPLKTIKRLRSIPPYNKFGEAVLGINTAPDVCGTIAIGDPVYAIRKKKLPQAHSMF